jgi:hypothetical protein
LPSCAVQPPSIGNNVPVIEVCHHGPDGDFFRKVRNAACRQPRTRMYRDDASRAD